MISQLLVLVINIILAAILIDDKNNHEYFSHKYNVSNKIKDELNLFAKNLEVLKGNKNFFGNDLEKNIYFNSKNYIISINLLNYIVNDKYKLSHFLENFKKILKAKKHKFPIDGQYLKKHGLQEGLILGKVLKKIEKEWVNNRFELSNKKILEIIKNNLN